MANLRGIVCAIASLPPGFPFVSMAFSLSDIVEGARLSARALLDYGDSFFNPTLRLGVTGLSRAGKTVFISALVHNLIHGGRLPVFDAQQAGGSRAPPGGAAGRRGAALRLRGPSAALIDERRLAGIRRAPFRELRLTSNINRLRLARMCSHADARHRRLSRRMAARPAAARQELCAIGRAKRSS